MTGGHVAERQQVPAVLQLFAPVPLFEYPLVEFTRDPRTFARRRSEEDGLSGESPANAVPTPIERVHDGAPVVSP